MICWDLDLVTNLWETTADLSDFYGLPRGVDYSQEPASALSAVHPDDIPAVLAGRQRAVETDEPMRYEFRGRVPGRGWPAAAGSRPAGRCSATRHGQARRLVAVTTDITERKRAEAEREALEPATARRSAVGEPGRTGRWVAHDFNNILTVILGSAGSGPQG